MHAWGLICKAKAQDVAMKAGTLFHAPDVNEHERTGRLAMITDKGEKKNKR